MKSLTLKLRGKMKTFLFRKAQERKTLCILPQKFEYHAIRLPGPPKSKGERKEKSNKLDFHPI